MGNCQTQPQNNNELQIQPPRAKFNPFFSTNQQQQTEHQILKQYRFVSNYEDKFLGRCSVLEKQNQNLYLCKDIFFDNDDNQCTAIYNKLLQKKSKYEYSEEVIRIKEVIKKKAQGFINDETKIILLVEYPLVSLKKQFNNRIINRLQFEKEQITNILYSTIRGYATIQRAGVINSKVRSSNIFVGVDKQQSLIKVIDADLLPTSTNSEIIKKYGVTNLQNYEVYLSPQQFKSYISEEQMPLSQKSGVFSLGATILDLCHMDSCQRLYSRKQLSRLEFKNLVTSAGKKYGAIIQNFLLDMLEFDQAKRLSFSELQRKIPNIFSQHDNQSSLRLSTVRSNAAGYIQNDNKSLRNSRISNSSGGKSNNSLSNSRVFTSSIKIQKPEEEQLEYVHLQYTNGNRYIGNKKNGLRHGKGKYIFKDRSYYEGSWYNNKMQGKGQLYNPNGKLQYEGQWRQDEPNGWGIQYSYDQQGKKTIWDKYQGQFYQGQMHGRGKIYFKNNTTYEGQFQNSKIQGKGRKIEPNGNVIQRDWSPLSFTDFIKQNQTVYNKPIA